MLPALREGDLDAAVLVAMDRIDAAATPEHAATLERARQVNAVIGLIGAPVVFLLLAGWVLFAWLRLRPRPALPRRSIDLRRRAAGRPHAGVGCVHPRRRPVPASADDRAARPRESR